MIDCWVVRKEYTLVEMMADWMALQKVECSVEGMVRQMDHQTVDR